MYTTGIHPMLMTCITEQLSFPIIEVFDRLTWRHCHCRLRVKPAYCPTSPKENLVVYYLYDKSKLQNLCHGFIQILKKNKLQKSGKPDANPWEPQPAQFTHLGHFLARCNNKFTLIWTRATNIKEMQSHHRRNHTASLHWIQKKPVAALDLQELEALD